jgi:hypothetical protein
MKNEKRVSKSWGICMHCKQPIYKLNWMNRLIWVHDEPLGNLKVSAEEAYAVHSDPPRKGEPLHRESFIHEAKPQK